MPLNDPIQSLLRRKDGNLWSVSPDNSVYDAVALMAEKEIGALPVMQGGQLVGLLSERDYARKIILMGRSSKETRVGEIMTSPAVTVHKDTSLYEVGQIMQQRHIRAVLFIKRHFAECFPTVCRIHLIGGFAQQVRSGCLGAANGIAKRPVISRIIFRCVSQNTGVRVAGRIQRLADRPDASIHHV